MKKIKDLILDLFFTPNGTCPICGKVLLSTDYYLCSRCYRELPQVELTRCKTCGRPVVNSEKCLECAKAAEKAPDGGCTWLDYKETAEKLISEMKFHSRQGLCEYAGRELASIVMDQSWISDIDVLVPVPLHPNRLKARGYNQSFLIAEGLSEALEKASGRSYPVGSLLKRVIDTPHQVGKGRQDRLGNLNDAFTVADQKTVEGKQILLIDDVMTTGTTTRICIETLREAGAAKVYTATCAGVADLSRS